MESPQGVGTAPSEVPEKRVDPAALLVAVLAVGVGPLFEDGAWSWSNFAVALLVLAVILCFIVPARPALRSRGFVERLPIALAQALVAGFVTAIGSAVMFQRLPTTTELSQFCGPEPSISDPLDQRWYWGSCEATLTDQAASAATPWALIPGAAMTVVLLCWLAWPLKPQKGK